MVIEGCSSSYSVFSQMKKEGRHYDSSKSMAYKNVYKRIIKLSKIGYLEEIKPSGYMEHGRKDYQVTIEGIKRLIPYVVVHPEYVQTIIDYMNKFGMDKSILGKLLANEFSNMLNFIDVLKGIIKENPLPGFAMSYGKGIEKVTEPELYQRGIETLHEFEKIYREAKYPDLDKNTVRTSKKKKD